ncbi:MAG TPA: hypothetical protein VKB19_10200, partial [Pedobacter sp.]|nr:hypothetical protein [Pedobacter sp.]
NNIIAHTKSDLVRFCKKIQGVVLNCASYHEILSSSDCVVIARVDFKFPEFVQQNYVTVEKDASGAWRISQISRFNL